MNWWEALILGILQGLTEFLPVSSSGHLELAKAVLGIHTPDSLIFTVVVHGATVLSTIVVFWNDIVRLAKAPFRLKWDQDNQYIAKLLVSAIPVAIVGLLFEDQIEQMFTGNVLFVGIMLLITTALLAISALARDRKRPISFLDAIIIGIAQAFAVLPGISRSGATISTGLLLGNDRNEVAKFSFLMVLIPVIGANLKSLWEYNWQTAAENQISASVLLIGFLAAFITGLLACKFMINIVRKSKLSYFAIYTFILSVIAIIYGLNS